MPFVLRHVLRLFVLAVLLSGSVGAQTPPTINYQGLVLGADGKPKDGPVDIEIGIWDASAGGSRLYREQHSGTTLTNGVFNLLLGTGSNREGVLGAETFAESDRWLELKVDGESLSPRIAFSSVPYAMHAATAAAIDGLDADALVPRTGGSFTGAISVNGVNGHTNVAIGSEPDNPDYGVVVSDANGSDRVVLRLSSSGDGAAILTDAADNPSVLLSASTSGGTIALFNPDRSIGAFMSLIDGAGVVQTLGQNGSLNASMGAVSSDPDHGSFAIFDEHGATRGQLRVASDGVGVVETFGQNGSVNAIVGTPDAEPNNGKISVHDGNGNSRAMMEAVGAGAGYLSLQGPNGKDNAELFSYGSPDEPRGAFTLKDSEAQTRVLAFVDDQEQGRVDVINSDGFLGAMMTVREDGEGSVATFGPQGEIGNLNTIVSSVIGDPNRGSISVLDPNSVIRAGMFVNSSNHGQIFADVKNFVVDYPNRPGLKIMYTSLEGPEAAIYQRGIVPLIAGRGTIGLPEHFLALANRDTITVQLTPASFESQGVGFEFSDDGRIEVRELHGGTGSYDVHYLVHAVRKGYENQKAVVNASDLEIAYGGAAMGAAVQNRLRAAAAAARRLPSSAGSK